MAIDSAEQKRRQEELKKYNDELERQQRLQEDLTADEREFLELQKEKLELEKQFLEVGEAAQGVIKNRLQDISNRTKALDGLISKQQRLIKQEDEAAQALQDSTKTILEATLGLNTRGNALTNLIKLQKEGGSATNALSKAFKGNGGAALRANLAMGVATGIMQKFTEETVKAAKQSEEFVDTLGRQAGMITSRSDLLALRMAAQESDNVYASFERVGNAAFALQEATDGVLGNILKTNKELPIFAAEAFGLGVNIDTTADFFGKFSMIMGKDAIGSMRDFERQAILVARSSGRMSDKVVQDTTKIADRFAEFGGGAGNISLEFQKISAATKVSTDSLVNMVSGFETFQGAQSTFINLRNVFGDAITEFVSYDQMFRDFNDPTKGPASTLLKLLEGVKKAGIDLNDPMAIRHFANAMNMGKAEVAALGRFLEKSNTDALSLADSIEKAGLAGKEAANNMKPMAKLTDTLNKLGEKFAVVFEPVIDMLSGLIRVLDAIPAPILRIIGGATAGGAAGSVLPGIGTAAGAVIGAGLTGITEIFGQASAGRINDGVIHVKNNGGRPTVTTQAINSQDDLRIIASRPGGPIASMSGFMSPQGGIGTAEISVNLFGQQLKNVVVDLIESEMSNRRRTQSVTAGV